MKILIAPSAYKGSLNAGEIAAAIHQGLSNRMPGAQIQSLPLADGGDGTIEAIHSCLGGDIETMPAQGPLGKPVTACWLALPDKIIIELAQCCGLAMLQGQKLQPLVAHTYGLGQVISYCLSHSGKKIIIGLGGSASTDGGTAALSALGAKFLDSEGNQLPFGGGFLTKLHSIDLSQLYKHLDPKQIEVLTDVRSPLLGVDGAANVFAPQKGANAEQIKILEHGLSQLADVVQQKTHKDWRNIPGTGAAGGTAFGFASLLEINILPGFKTIAEIIQLQNKIEISDLVITAEGRLDYQSLSGKATGELAKMCKILNKPLFVLPASVQDNIDWRSSGIKAVFTTAPVNGLAKSEDVIIAAQKLATEYIDSNGIFENRKWK